MKKLLWILLVVVAIIVITGIVLWNKPHARVEDAKAVAITATALQQAYSSDEEKANTQYLNKAIAVRGEVTEVTPNQDGGTMVVLKTDDPLAAVQCTMREQNVTASPGQTIAITGFCSGYNSITGVSLTDCVLQKDAD